MKGNNSRRLWILGLIVVIVLGILIIPKLFFNEGDSKVDFKVMEENQIPEKIMEILPQYKKEERALACKIENKVYVVVTRGEKKTDGYSVSIDEIRKLKTDDAFNLVVKAKYKDPGPDQIVPQVITYPHIIVETKLQELPKKIKLEVLY